MRGFVESERVRALFSCRFVIFSRFFDVGGGFGFLVYFSGLVVFVERIVFFNVFVLDGV